MEPILNLSINGTYFTLLVFGLFMLIVTYLFARWKKYTSVEGFLVGRREVNWLLGGSSIAASWIWAPALFVSTLFAYQSGLVGLFWFVFPNILALGVFAILAPTIRKKMPYGYTLPQWIRYKLQDEKVHKIYLFPFFFYQLMAVTVQLYAGGNLLALMLGIPVSQAVTILAIAVLAAIPLIYSLLSGLEASIITDFIQLLIIILSIVIIIPWVIMLVGGQVILSGLGGIANNTLNIFDPKLAFSLGIVTAIGLLSGAISDQQYWQRGFAIKKGHLKKAFIFGALAFGLVPIALGLLGFIGASPDVPIAIPEGIDSSMIGVLVVTKLLPVWASILFVIMLISALSSTIDSGLNAVSSLYATDVMKYTKKEQDLMLRFEKGEHLSDKEKLEKHLLDARRMFGSRTSMVVLTIVGYLVAMAVIFIPKFELFHLWWVFNTIAACVVVPTVLSLYWDRLNPKGVFWGVMIAFFVGLPIFIYSNFIQNNVMTVLSSLGIIAVTTLFCLAMPRKTPLQTTQLPE
ncbi:hypothetical protein COY15_01105 [Candidatus Roizmanbacteria bacterium CG_4_10_14_0_2_um_filter_39_12]|nr:MAG: hypothetical protein COY15_01105 [Candidatus Roizmanbacteria bacterium CG_4_10_14_0_2_um_filter_39_12]